MKAPSSISIRANLQHFAVAAPAHHRADIRHQRLVDEGDVDEDEDRGRGLAHPRVATAARTEVFDGDAFRTARVLQANRCGALGVPVASLVPGEGDAPLVPLGHFDPRRDLLGHQVLAITALADLKRGQRPPEHTPLLVVESDAGDDNVVVAVGS